MARRILEIDLNSPTAAYEQIVNGLRTLLVAGEFQPGEQLPTVRQLAIDLGVHHNTVAEAYRLLAEEGWLDLRRGRGATIIERPGPRPTAKARAEFGRCLRELAAKAIAEGVPRTTVAREIDSFAASLREGGEP
jgi:GntR family transcriptional regulator